MKKLMTALLAAGCCLSLCGCGKQGAGLAFTVILLIFGGLLLLFGLWRLLQYSNYRKRQMRRGRKVRKLDGATILVLVLAVIMLIVALVIPGGEPRPGKPNKNDPQAEQTKPSTEAPTDPLPVYEAYHTDNTDPANWGITWEIYKDGVQVSSYQRSEPISFGEPEDYFALPGVATFRGNNYRDQTSYASVEAITEQKLTTAWTVETGTLAGGVWSGSGWTGQPLIVQWPAETRAIMNMYPDKQAKEDLVEVIYATLDGHIYFLDLDDGKATRDPIDIGLCMKGAGALDPRGYPIMYVGAGDVNYYGTRPEAYIISLIDGKILYRFGQNDPLALRQDNSNWTAFASSPLVDAETDTLIWPGENGILYTMKLNTQYDQAAGTISVSPTEQVVARYNTSRSNKDTYWLGFEASVSICEQYLYLSENGGMFFCIDLNTMELVWAQDTKDDSNGSPVFRRTGVDSGEIYTAPSLHWTKDSSDHGSISIYKLDAVTGEILWQHPFSCYTVSGVSGGVQSTMLQNFNDGLVYFTVSRTPDLNNGVLVALDATTGIERWELKMDHYTWSSPVMFCDSQGNKFVAVGDSAGKLFLLNALTGQVVHTHDVGGLVEATPVIFGDRIIIGTRNEQILCLEIS